MIAARVAAKRAIATQIGLSWHARRSACFRVADTVAPQYLDAKVATLLHGTFLWEIELYTVCPLTQTRATARRCEFLARNLLGYGGGDMRWTPGGTSGDIEDRRDEDYGSSGMGFGGYGPHLGIGGTILLLILSVIFRQNFFALFSGAPTAATRPVATGSPTAGQDTEVQFISFV